LIEALIANLPGPIGQSGGLIDSFEQGLTQVAGSFGSTEDSADLSATTETETVVGDGDATSETAESSSDADQVDESTTGDNALQPVNAGGNGAQSQPRSGRPGGFADQISDAINDFTGAITNSISGGNGQRAGQGGSSGVGPSSGGAGGGGLRSSGTDSSKGGAGTKGSGPSGGAGSAPGGNNG
jgi:hypothetical protein